jgi:hypothetical protein
VILSVKTHVTGARSLTSNKTMAELEVTSPTTGPTVAAETNQSSAHDYKSEMHVPIT